ncbi:MAG: hypothetical protein AAGI01_01235 [Myxococcota bacterium]
MSWKLDVGCVVLACAFGVCAAGCDARVLAAGEVTVLGATVAMMWMTVRLKRA